MKGKIYSVTCFPLQKTFIVFLLSIIICACASKQIEVKHFKGYDEIYEGEEARLEWSFKNVDKVVIEGLPGTYQPVDVVFVRPTQTTKYNIIAYKGTDSVVVTSRVTVKQLGKTKGIRRGAAIFKNFETKPSFLESDYFSGIIETKSTQGPFKLKVMRVIYPGNNQNEYTIRALLLDRFGNYVTDSAHNGSNMIWKSENSCDAVKSLQLIRDYKQSFLNKQNMDLAILLDNSAAAESNVKSLGFIKDFSQYLSPKDNIMFSSFNHNYYETLQLMPAEQALPELENVELPQRNGLNSMYKSLEKAMERLKGGENKDKAVILITYNSDNSSVIYNANDVIKTSRVNNIPIYIIAVGNSVNTYLLNYICQSSGGRLYAVTDDDINKIQNILQEILFAQKSYYEMKVQMPNDGKSCNNIKANIIYEYKETKVSETAHLIDRPLAPFSLYQAISSFDSKSSDVPQEYIENIKNLAKYLKDNSKVDIELSGHSGIEGNMSYNAQISLERANKVKDLMIKEGVSPSQIRIKAEACCKPVYFLEQYPWQSSCNRRVEVRWLDPQTLPYEIIAESTETEDDANNKVRIWESLGYRSYYDRYLMNNTPSYRVKIWGFSTLDEASTAAKSLEKKYKHNFDIE